MSWTFAYRALCAIAIAASLVLALRLAIVVAATPSDLWLVEYAPVAVGDRPPVSDGLAVRAAGWMNDPALARALIGDCVARSVAPVAEVRADCLAAIEYALSVQPGSSELWLALARLYSNQGILDERFAEALRNSYATGPREGVVAAERLPFVLRRRSFLPADLMESIGADIALVLSSRTLAGPLVQNYIADPFLREETWDLMEAYATLDQQEALIEWIRQALPR